LQAIKLQKERFPIPQSMIPWALLNLIDILTHFKKTCDVNEVIGIVQYIVYATKIGFRRVE